MRPLGGVPSRPLSDEDGVTPVIGSILVLAITVTGIAGVLFWGAPTLDRIQSRNAATAMEGEFEGLRDATLELSVPDHSRFPTVALPGGQISLVAGTRFMVTVDHDASNPNCDFHVSDWSDAGGQVTVASTGCRAPTTTCSPLPLPVGVSCFEVYSVTGTTTIRKTASLAGATATVTGVDFKSGDWEFRLTDGSASAPVTYSEAWLHSTDQITWSKASSTGTKQLYLEGGAVFLRDGDLFFLQKAPNIGDSSFGAGYYGVWLRTLVATSYSGLDGTGTHQVYFALLGNSVRTDASSAFRLRYDFSGALAQPWCNAMETRNPSISASAGTYFGIYKADPSFGCTAGGALGLRSVCFTEFAATPTPTPTPCTTAGTAFQLRLLHARIHTSLVV